MMSDGGAVQITQYWVLGVQKRMFSQCMRMERMKMSRVQSAEMWEDCPAACECDV